MTIFFFFNLNYIRFQCTKKVYKVDNYPISKQDQEDILMANDIIEKRKLIDAEEEYQLYGAITMLKILINCV